MRVCELAFCVCSLFVPGWPLYRAAAHCCCVWRASVHVLETTEGSDMRRGDPSSPRTPTCTNSPGGPRAAALHLYFSTVSSVVLSFCPPRLPRRACRRAVFVMAGCELGSNACQCCFFFFFLEAAGGKWEAIEAEKKDGIAGDLRTRCAPQCAGHG